MSDLYYVAYGSNLHPARLRQRIHSPQLIGVTALSGYSLSFGKRGQDNSGKCTLLFTLGDDHIVHGAVFRLTPSDSRILDEIEGVGRGYERTLLTCTVQGLSIEAYTYIASAGYMVDDLHPYGWYRQLVAEGARYHGFPASYVAGIEAVESMRDPDAGRRLKYEALLAEIRSSSPRANRGELKK
jgi:gamma-glutamylcyclotransferase